MCVSKAFLLLSTVLALSSCGGGGGGGGSGGESGGGPVSSPDFGGRRLGSGVVVNSSGAPDHAQEYARNWGLDAIHADAANDGEGLTGAGVKVAVIDSGIDIQHRDFSGAIDPASIDIVSGSGATIDDASGHGTAVAGIIGARRDGLDVRGVAYNSTLLAIRAENGTQPCCNFWHSDLATATDYAVAHGAKVLNYSLGGDSMGASFEAAMVRAANTDRLMVVAAGNGGNATPSYPAALAASMGGAVLAVGAVQPDSTLAAFSNQAGAAKDYYLVAPGVAVTTSAMGGGTTTVSGTSFAAPHVSGAAALLMEGAPHLTARQIADLLLTTATDLGAPGIDAVYGHGMLNLDQAMQPFGPLTVPDGVTVSGGGAALDVSALSLGGAFGDAVTHDGAMGAVAAFDSLGRAYDVSLDGRMQVASSAPDLRGWFQSQGKVEQMAGRLDDGTRLSMVRQERDDLLVVPGDKGGETRFALSRSFGQSGDLSLGKDVGLGGGFGLAAHDAVGSDALLNPAAVHNPFLGLAEQGGSLSFGKELGDGWRVKAGLSSSAAGMSAEREPAKTTAYAAELSRSFDGGGIAGVMAGQLVEDGALLGSVGSGAFGFDQPARTDFVGAFGTVPLTERVNLFGSYTLGWTQSGSVGNGLLSDIEGLRSQTAALGASVTDAFADGDRLSLTFSRPLKATAGTAVFDMPTGRKVDGTVNRERRFASLVPSGMELDIEAAYRLRLGMNEELLFSTLTQFEPGHVAGAGPEVTTGLKYRLTW